jgi:ATP-dependent DNA helicase RecG
MKSSTDRTLEHLNGLFRELIAMPTETEWVEFKQNNKQPEEIGEHISALSNSAALCGKVNAYLVWGVDDKTHKVVGTSFSPVTEKRGNDHVPARSRRWLGI